MTAHHQIAALDPGDVDLGRHRAADLRADLLEPRTVLILAGQFVEMIGDVLGSQSARRQ
ncbi:hypothetical protein D1872_340140 [compost metagenome]